MSVRVPAHVIERVVGAPRHPTEHLARAVSAEQQIYILHSHACLSEQTDLRRCLFSRALDNGVDIEEWAENLPLIVDVVGDKLTPRNTDGAPS